MSNTYDHNNLVYYKHNQPAQGIPHDPKLAAAVMRKNGTIKPVCKKLSALLSAGTKFLVAKDKNTGRMVLDLGDDVGGSPAVIEESEVLVPESDSITESACPNYEPEEQELPVSGHAVLMRNAATCARNLYARDEVAIPDLFDAREADRERQIQVARNVARGTIAVGCATVAPEVSPLRMGDPRNLVINPTL